MIKNIIILSIMMVGCGPVKTWQTKYPDNFIEEIIEDIIEDETGQEIDLSPATDEERPTFEIEFYEDVDED